MRVSKKRRLLLLVACTATDLPVTVLGASTTSWNRPVTVLGASTTSWTIVQGVNALPTGKHTTEKSLAACEAKADGHAQFTYNLHSFHCFVGDGTTFGGVALDHVTSGCDATKVLSGCAAPAPAPGPAPAPTPPPTPQGGACSTDTDCSLNGECTAGRCACDAAWTGTACSTLALLPGARDAGYRLVDDARWGNTSSWGGGGFYDAREKRWFMWATELAEHCGMHTWTTNSQTVRASSATGDGHYTREAVQFPIWSHESAVTRGPGGEYVAFFSYNAAPGADRPVCHLCTDGSTAPACKKNEAGAPPRARAPPAPPLGIESTDPTYMSWAATARGNWSKPVLVLGPAVQMDTNMAAVILPNGSLTGMWRDHHPGGKHSTPHLVTAADWRDPATYRYATGDLLFGGARAGKEPGRRGRH
eukprot:g6694.t1